MYKTGKDKIKSTELYGTRLNNIGRDRAEQNRTEKYRIELGRTGQDRAGNNTKDDNFTKQRDNNNKIDFKKTASQKQDSPNKMIKDAMPIIEGDA